MQIVIVIVVVFAGVFEVDASNWSPFMPNGFKAVVTGSTVVFFAYVGFDAVANSAEEAKRPQVNPIFSHTLTFIFFCHYNSIAS
jgi:APA family basic amino acid/polyamine antiporter